VFARASDAVAAAVALQQALDRRRWPTGIALPTRAALHTGEAELRDHDYFGQALNRAARLRALGRGGQVLLSRATAELVADQLPDGAELRAALDRALGGQGHLGAGQPRRASGRRRRGGCGWPRPPGTG
jgi:class 3 adenylate cyclase